jgi:hypothetical protein
LFCLSRFVLLALPDVQEHVQEPVPQTADPVIITHKAGDEKSQAFWRMLVSGDPETALVAKATASFVCQSIATETIGSRRAGELSFKHSCFALRLATQDPSHETVEVGFIFKEPVVKSYFRQRVDGH